jgi:hypothetical protein
MNPSASTSAGGSVVVVTAAPGLVVVVLAEIVVVVIRAMQRPAWRSQEAFRTMFPSNSSAQRNALTPLMQGVRDRGGSWQHSDAGSSSVVVVDELIVVVVVAAVARRTSIPRASSTLVGDVDSRAMSTR